MKKIFYIIALGVGLAGCSNNEDELKLYINTMIAA